MKGYLRHLLLWSIALLTLSGCNTLDSIPYSPEQTPAAWLSIQPYVDVRIGSQNIVLVQPSSTALVYSLGILTIAIGLNFLRIQNTHRSRQWWGIALLLWGVGALLAGTSYQAFSYEIKCAGREICSWTSWWEVIYLVLSAASVDAMMVAAAYSCGKGKWRKAITFYAFVNIIMYVIVVSIGAAVPIRFLISFDLLLLVAAPNIVILFILNGWRYIKLRGSMDLALLGTWVWLGITMGMYSLYQMLDITQDLWAQGIWFSENDVLHIGLIVWMVYIALVVSNRVKDMPISSGSA